MWLFVYGSLKLGECNHHHVRPWLRGVRAALGPGQLYLRPDGYPALCLEPSRWLTLGTADLLSDAAACADPFPVAQAGSIPGELLELGDPAAALAHLDQFEGFYPGHESEYWRVLIPCQGLRAWTYVCRPEQAQGWSPLEAWPPPGRAAPAPYTSGRLRRPTQS